MHLCLQLSSFEHKKLLVLSVNGVMLFSTFGFFYKGMLGCLEKMLTRSKWKSKLECKIFLVRHFKSFISQFVFV
jgi:hypothetical protein